MMCAINLDYSSVSELNAEEITVRPKLPFRYDPSEFDISSRESEPESIRPLSRPSGTFVCGSRCLSDNGERILLQWAAIVSIWFYFGPDGPGRRARNRLVLDGSLLTSLYHLMSLLPLFHPCLVFSNVSSCFYTNDPHSWNNVASWLIKISLMHSLYFSP